MRAPLPVATLTMALIGVMVMVTVYGFRTRAAKVLYVIAMSTKKAAEDAEVRRQRALKDAADMLSKEHQKGRVG